MFADIPQGIRVQPQGLYRTFWHTVKEKLEADKVWQIYHI